MLGSLGHIFIIAGASFQQGGEKKEEEDVAMPSILIGAPPTNPAASDLLPPSFHSLPLYSVRKRAREEGKTPGSFWMDMDRRHFFFFFPLSSIVEQYTYT